MNLLQKCDNGQFSDRCGDDAQGLINPVPFDRVLHLSRGKIYFVRTKTGIDANSEEYGSE
ncbi:hypothetical protein N7488_008575 [Penicillium malachiteum]|nr:hypothetical protein N7488_008575 [Penicillium malachiteum]